MSRRLRVVLISAACVLLALGYVGEVLAEATTGHSLDPTDPMNYNFYALRNDSASPLYVRLCDDPRCTRLDGHFEWASVRPGSAEKEQVYWGDSAYAVYAVSSTSEGTDRRCLFLDASKKADTTVDVPLSSAGRCEP